MVTVLEPGDHQLEAALRSQRKDLPAPRARDRATSGTEAGEQVRNTPIDRSHGKVSVGDSSAQPAPRPCTRAYGGAMSEETKAVVIAAASGLVAGLVANKVRKEAAPHLPRLAVAFVGGVVFVVVRSTVSNGLSRAL